MQKLGLGWTMIKGVAGDPSVGIRAGQVVAISHEGITVSNDGWIETFTQQEAEKMLFVNES